MKIIGIVGSPRKQRSNTGRLVDLVLEGAKGEGAETATVILPGPTVLPCKACDACHKTGSCSQKDDFESLKQQIYESDGIVLGSPNYIWSVSAQMKAFMDRCCGVIHCMSFEGRYGASVVTSGGGGEEPIAEYMNRFLISTGITPVGSVWATMGAAVGVEFPENVCNQAVELGKKLVRSWAAKATFPEVEEAKNEFKERFRLLMLYRKEDWPFEWKYWQEHYGLE